MRSGGPGAPVGGDMDRDPSELLAVYRTLLGALGPQDWWPGDGPLEVVVGAVLTQNTSWRNVELALDNLRRSGALSLEALTTLTSDRLEELIRPAGFFRRKTQTLRELAELCVRVGGGLEGLIALPPRDLRRLLLTVTGVGRETADSIMLYAAGHPTFVVDTYTRRFATRHGFARANATYEELQALFEGATRGAAPMMNEFHALLVELGKKHCRPSPGCADCPLREDLPSGGPLQGA